MISVKSGKFNGLNQQILPGGSEDIIFSVLILISQWCLRYVIEKKDSRELRNGAELKKAKN